MSWKNETQLGVAPQAGRNESSGQRLNTSRDSQPRAAFQRRCAPTHISAIESAFREFAEGRWLILPLDLKPDSLTRCATVGKPRGRDGAVLIHLDGVPAGGCQNYRDGIGWQNWRADASLREHTDADQWRARATAERAARAAERALTHALAADRARTLWASARMPDPLHPYLIRKRILAHAARQIGEALVLPMFDAAGVLWSLQFIRPDGGKRFLKGGRKSGLYCPIGHPAGVICIAEGFATAATIHEATGHAVAIAFDCGNLHAVGLTLRRKFPSIELRFCADDDSGTEGNPGLTKAIEAARAVDGTMTLPAFGEVAP